MTVSRTFFIVDDDVIIRGVIKRVLRRSFPGSRFEEASNGSEALVKLPALVPCTMVIDFNMPEMNGIRVCARVRRDMATSNIKIIMTTAEPIEGLREKALNSGADAFLPKPFLAHELVALAHAHKPA